MKRLNNNLKKIFIGFMAGVISGLFTAGGGLILVPAFMYMLKIEPKKARATSIFCILPMVITTAFFYSKNNLINWNTGILCAIGGIIGGFIGAKLLNKIPDKYLKLAFAIFLIYAGWNMLF
jgi:uncharacterized membrane protein YfcA